MISKTGKILNIETEDDIPKLESLLKEGDIVILFVNAGWCSHCVKFKKDIWGPMCKKPAVHHRASIKAELMGKTSLADAKYKYLPSILVINEKGKPEEFQTPEGDSTNAMPTPKSVEDMTRVVNVPLKPMPNEQKEYYETQEQFVQQRGGSLLHTLTQIAKGKPFFTRKQSYRKKRKTHRMKKEKSKGKCKN